MSSSVQSKKKNNNHDFIWKELSLQNNVKVYYCMQIQANKIAHIYLGAYIYLSIWVLHKTDVGNFFTYVMILFFFSIYVCNCHVPTWIKKVALPPPKCEKLLGKYTNIIIHFNIFHSLYLPLNWGTKLSETNLWWHTVYPWRIH